MRIVKADSEIIKRLEKNGISKEMLTFFQTSKWLVIAEQNDETVGAAGVGGIFNLAGVEIQEKYYGKGLGALLQRKLIQESKKRGYSFNTVMINPKNESSVKLHNSFGFLKCFRINYSVGMIQDVGILAFNWKGRLVEKFLKNFNNKINMIFLACLLKMLKSLFPFIINLNEKDIPTPSIKWIIKNFEKI